MYTLFFQKFRERVPLTDAEAGAIQNYLTPKKLRKKQYLLQEGDVCKYMAFVEKGLLRKYLVDDDATEHIIQFALEGWTIADLYSFLTAEPAHYHIDAIEDCELILISKTAHEELLEQQPKYERYMRLLVTDAYVALQKRVTSFISAPTQDQYTSFIHTYPDLAQRVPQHMIASYMGLKPETLSRIRKKIK